MYESDSSVVVCTPRNSSKRKENGLGGRAKTSPGAGPGYADTPRSRVRVLEGEADYGFECFVLPAGS